MIEGDNYDALLNLQYTHKGKIDLIYIDPPYNTGSKDFVYNDRFVDREDSFRHSKWLSFMAPRLVLARELLSDNGVIFVSIDNNEQAQMKLLFNEIFGEDKFVSNIHVELSLTQGMKVGAAQNGQIVKNAEHILVYSKTNNWLGQNPLYDEVGGFDEHFTSYMDINEKPLKISSFRKFLEDASDIRPYFEKFKLDYSLKSLQILFGLPEFKEYFYKNYSNKLWQSMMASVNIPDSIMDRLNKGEIVIYDKYILHRVSSGKIRQLLPLSKTIGWTDDYVPKYSRRRIRGDLWKNFYIDMMNIAKEGDMNFKNGKKPIRLLKQIINFSSNKNATVLDFFAGSGTTAHAVLALNAEDGGNRECIVVTNNEGGGEDPEKGIARSVCHQRIKKVIQGYEKQTNKKEKVSGLGGSLEYWRTGKRRAKIEAEDDWLELMENIDILSLKESIKFSETKENEKDEQLIVSGEDKSFTVSDQSGSDYKLSLNNKEEGSFPGEMIAAYQAAIEIVEEVYLDPISRFFTEEDNSKANETIDSSLEDDAPQSVTKEDDDEVNEDNQNEVSK